jgi:hypothetical protein
MLSGLRGRTRTTTSCSRSEIPAGKPPFYAKTILEGVPKTKAPEIGRLFSE